MLFMSFFMAGVLGLLLVGAGAPLWGLWKWRGGWRIAAAVPALMMAFVIGRFVVDTARDPTSHNLWPFEILIWGGASAVVMGVLALAKWLSQRT
jgi:NADPH:quinone reductase-like Zn-dependent oxidoreductase